MVLSSSELIADAVNARPLTTRHGLLERLFNLSFGGFVYNQIWEDPAVDIQALRLEPRSRILTISSGGCNVLNYLARGVASIDAVDLNAHHLHLLKLKLLGLAHFPTHEDFFAYFGNAHDFQNVHRYRSFLQPHLDPAARRHWGAGALRKPFGKERFRYFETGLWRQSSMGTFLRFLHTVARGAGMQPARILECTTLEDQQLVFATEIAPFFKSPLVRGIAKLPFVLHALGVPPRQYETFKNEAPEGILQEFRTRIKRLACQFPIQDNYFAWQAFGGHYDLAHRRAIPNYLKAENFDFLKNRVRRVKTHLTSVTGFLATQPPASLNRFVLLDAQDWMTPDQITALWRQIRRTGQPGSRIIFRSGTATSPVESALPQDLRSRFTYDVAVSKTLFQQDRSAIYGGFHLYIMH